MPCAIVRPPDIPREPAIRWTCSQRMPRRWPTAHRPGGSRRSRRTHCARCAAPPSTPATHAVGSEPMCVGYPVATQSTARLPRSDIRRQPAVPGPIGSRRPRRTHCVRRAFRRQRPRRIPSAPGPTASTWSALTSRCTASQIDRAGSANAPSGISGSPACVSRSSLPTRCSPGCVGARGTRPRRGPFCRSSFMPRTIAHGPDIGGTAHSHVAHAVACPSGSRTTREVKLIHSPALTILRRCAVPPPQPGPDHRGSGSDATARLRPYAGVTDGGRLIVATATNTAFSSPAIATQMISCTISPPLQPERPIRRAARPGTPPPRGVRSKRMR